MPLYDPVKDIPSLSGKVILITGGTNGLGVQTVLNLAAHSPAHIFFTGRSTTSAEKVIADAKAKSSGLAITFLPIDHASLASVRDGANKLLTLTSRLDLLICNAGVMALPASVTQDGYEIQFGVNHLSHALLTKLLLPTLLTTAKLPGADVRIVYLTSLGYRGHPSGGIQFATLKSTQAHLFPIGPWQRYGQSKVANVLYASSLAKKYGDKGIISVSVHPGVFNTGIVQNLSWGNKAFVWLGNAGKLKDEKVEGEGAWNTCWAATSPKEKVVNGALYLPVGEKGEKARDGGNETLEEELWTWTEKELEPWVSG